MGVKWTSEQESAIMSPKDSNLGAQTLLVAAAAGSGKTAVLVERIITRLKDMENPLSVQELMVVTFTKAAAAEMSARIGVALAKAMESTDDKVLQARLERQLNLLPSAHISTLHSFCQWVIRSYFYKLDIPPTARIGNEAEMALLKQEVLENLLKEAYEHNAYGIFDLSDFFSDDKSDAGLQDKVLSLYEFAMSQSNPDGWMRYAVEPYEAAQQQDLRDTLWGRAMWDDQQAEINRIADRIELMEPLLESPVGPKKWDKVYQEQLAALAQLKGAQTWSDMVDVCRNLDTFTKASFTSLGKALEKGEVDGALADEFKSLGSQNKDSLKGMKNGLFHIDESVLQQQFKDQYPLIHNLVELTIAFHKAYDEAKKEQGIMDFSDLEHLCLALLVEPSTEDDPKPSEVALELQDTFKEIMVDEYQDTNGVQETIINLISKKDNRFYVGDVKQAIYSFRMADSSLFMNKYNTYGLMNDAVERRIDLAKNFRSHENILTTTNFIFYQIMTQEAAELDYGEKESLIPGRIVEDAPSDWVGGAVELHLLDTSDTNHSDETDSDSEAVGDEPENNERELDFIIQKIKELHASKKQVQNADGSFRHIQWRDFAVLRRSLAGWGTRAVAAMRQAGIPAVVNERDGYFEAQEIQLLLSLLQIIDNPEQDLPMAAVLHSGLVGLDANELGVLRLTGDGSLWSVMPLYANQAQDERLLQFIARIEHWRTLSRRHGVADLLWDIYETLDYVNYVGAMPNGLVRRANVMALYERAKGFESSGFRGLFRFLRFVESLRDSNQDMAVANVVTEADDVVRLMTIHKSKGLEFPVVFLSGVQKKFNTMDFNSPLLVDKNGGIGLKGYYPDIRVSYPSMPWLYCKSIKSDAMKAEEQRILYVALTRARDKLFLTGYINKEIKKEKGVGAHIKHAALTQTQALGADLIKAGNSYLHWLLIAFSRHLTGGAPLRNIIELEGATNFDLLDRQCQVKVEIHDGSLYGDLDYKADVDETTINTVRALGKVNDVALPEEIVQRFAFTYPNLVAAKTTAKISVSELKRRFAERDAEAVSATDVSIQQKPVPSCGIADDTTDEAAIVDSRIPAISETEIADSVFGRKPMAIADAEEIVTGAQWGTLMHEAMQWLPVKTYTQQSMTDMLDSLQAEGKFSDDERSVLSDRSLYTFFNSDIGKRLITSKRIERELPFSMLFDGNRVYPDVESGERLFLQGIIDTAFVEDDQWVLVDYKTDRVKSGDELIRRYKIQMDLYKEALETLTNMPVKASYIYSFYLHEAVLL
ncbi:helicase-exonuclease AddAB subunit AddA [uncultured Veillonella sp.]|uniref:helicase-exonuclease AddAB subunit AddA n=1 Tax=uncultured Veillonella sp. TaxID=159268 RepID=UPI0025F26971|nr:helicase-exonuclease AddAB subunit AddA [uncultured Veillonella sp.]